MHVKAVLIVHNAAIDGEVHDLLASIGVDCYSKLPEVLGRGRGSEPHLNTEVWPGVNCATLIVVEDGQARAAMDAVRRMRRTFGSEGVKAFLWEIQEIT